MSLYKVRNNETETEIQCDVLTEAIKQCNLKNITGAKVLYYPGGKWLEIGFVEIAEALLQNC